MAVFHLGCKSPAPSTTPHAAGAREESAPTAWRAYDAALCDAIGTRWLQLLEQRTVSQDNGRVVLQFRLRPDGTIAELRVAENTEGEAFGALCQKAVQDPAPYACWPAEMCARFGSGRRFRVTFEFDARGEGYFTYVTPGQHTTDSPGRETEALIVLYLPEQRKQTSLSSRPWNAQVSPGALLGPGERRANSGPVFWSPAVTDYLQSPSDLSRSAPAQLPGSWTMPRGGPLPSSPILGR